jgi:hypothetical protein
MMPITRLIFSLLQGKEWRPAHAQLIVLGKEIQSSGNLLQGKEWKPVHAQLVVMGKEIQSPAPVHAQLAVQGKKTQSPIHTITVMQEQNTCIMKQPLPLHKSMFKIDQISMR